MIELLRRRWDRFTHPLGRQRIWNPALWRWNERVLVFGEFLAFSSAGMAMYAQSQHWHSTTWFLLAAPILGSASLFWYAWDTVTTGDRPLTSASIQNIRRVVQGVMMEDAGAMVDWQHPDEQGSIPMRIG